VSDESRTQSSASVKLAQPLPGGVIRVLDGSDRGRTLRLDQGPAVIGSSSACDLVVRDPKVSRRHLEVTLGPLGFRVKDLGSRNGTVFEGSRLTDATVPPGAMLRIGDTHLVLMAIADERRLEPSTRDHFGRLVGSSLAMRQVFALLERAAQTDSTVLLQGETGTGKELAARALHDEGSRAGRRYEVFDCGAVAPALIASDLFGHVRGAFTGAATDRPGVFERAHGGTVFIDEIAELPLDLQPALLRICDRGEVQPVGSARRIAVDVRIIAATRRDLPAEVLGGRFREDLFYRLSVLPITMPPLRARASDLPALCRRILIDLGVEDPGPIDGPNLGLLAAHRWPGNVRELRNVLERALVRAGGPVPFRSPAFQVSPPDDPDERAEPDGDTFQVRKKQAIARFEREFLEDLMRSCDGNILRASHVSGIERTQLKRLLRRNRLL
jgi:DNA-binding NtrC family response regulator